VIKHLAGIFLIARIACRRLPIDWDVAWSNWLKRPAIEIVLTAAARPQQPRLWRRLDEVYPF
jgi:hypothetical protein